MGIRGLTTYINQNKERSFEPYRLQNCYLVIDGNSVASTVYRRTFERSKRSHCAFGGDYDEYARAVRRFFYLLTCCYVKAIVIFDGGKEPRKQATTWARLKGKIQASGSTTPMSCPENVFPLLLVEVFGWVAARCGAIVAQCDFEADEEIAALSRALYCPLLSYDSDFFIHAVPCYIPFPTLATKLTEEIIEPIEGSSSGRHIQRFIECSAFNVDKFLSGIDKGGWRRKSSGAKNILQAEVLPLIAALLGNDYVKPNTFGNFFSQIQLPKKHNRSFQQRKIVGLLEWLRLEESLDSAIKKILNHAKIGRRDYLEKLIRQTVDVYVGFPSQLFHQLKLSVMCESKTSYVDTTENTKRLEIIVNEDIKAIAVGGFLSKVQDKSGSSKDLKCDPVTLVENSDDLDNLSFNEEDHSCSGESQSFPEDSDSEEDEQNYEWDERKKQLPSWFLDRYRQGELPPCFMDIMMQRNYLCIPQVEDHSQPHSHEISFPILSAILRLLTPENNDPLECLSRINKHAVSIILEPLPKPPSWPLPENLLKISQNDRMEILMQALNFFSKKEEENKVRRLALRSLPPDWRLLGLCLAYWKKFSQQKVDERHLIAACFCIVVLRVIDERAGPFGHKRKKVRKENKNESIKEVDQNESEKFNENERESDSLGNNLPTFNKNPEEAKNVAGSTLNPEKKNNKKILGVRQLQQLVSTNECIEVSRNDGKIFQMRQVDGGAERLCYRGGKNIRRMKPSSFNMSTVHIFAEFQSVLLHVAHLNSLLGKPLPPNTLHTSFTGTLTYNAYYQTRGKSGCSIKALFQSLLGMSAPTLENLMDEFFSCVMRLELGTDFVETILWNTSTKKKKYKKPADKNVQKETIHKVESPGKKKDVFYDAGNKFSALRLID